MNIAGILLAAGRSTRFGRDKLIEPLGDTCIAAQSALNLLPHVQSLTIVIAKDNHPLANRLENITSAIVSCAHSHQGMSASLICGIQHTMNSDGWLIALADMPFIQQDVYAKITSAAQQGNTIVVPRFQNQRGHPVFISKKFRGGLLQLQGDCGARDLLRAHAHEIVSVEVSDAGILRDVDYPLDMNS
ncbi:MAG: molybdenum cofactor cytidylyltransferase [Pseudomonadota bacterium]|nr:molybdenum cofactor cytidylyltransferase [Pseudomonadota bacterium]